MSNTKSVVYNLDYTRKAITFGTVVINHITNPFDPINSRVSKTDLHGSTLDTYLPGFCLGKKYFVKLNKEILPLDYDYSSYVVKANDIISFTPVIEGGGGGGGKQIMAMVALIALTVLTAGAAAPLTASIGASLGITGIGLTALSISLMVAGSLLINAIFSASTSSSLASIDAPELTSSTYSWNGIQTNRDLNRPIPVLYGTHALGGTVINNRFAYNGNDDWIFMQLALCHGEIEAITEDTIKINDSLYSSFITSSENTISFDYRTGQFDQSIMPGFSDSTYNNGAASRKVIYNEPYTFQSISTNMDFFRMHFEMPKGCYVMDSTTGAKYGKSLTVKVKYRKVGDTEWIPMYSYVPVFTTEYLHNYWDYYRDAGDGTSSNLRAFWSQSPNSIAIHDSDTNTTSYSWITSSRSVHAGYGYSDYMFISLNTSVAYKIYYEPMDATGQVLTIPEGQYEFQVTRLTPESPENSPYDVSDLHVRFLEEVQTADVNYGGVALLGINIKATDQLSNNRPNVTTTVTRKHLLINGEYKDSTNPAWICLDILTNKNYGMGLDISKTNLTEFNRWAAFCDGGIGEYFQVHNIVVTSDVTTVREWDLIIPATIIPAGEELLLSNLNLNTSSVNILDSNGNALSITDIEKIEKKYLVNDANLDDGLYYFVTFNRLLGTGTYVEYSLYSKTSNFTNTPKLQFNGLFDTTGDIWSSLQDVAKIGRGQVILQGSLYSVIFDEPKIVTGLYNAANSNNVVVKYIGRTDIASEIEIQYTDKNIGYEMNSISVQDTDSMASNVTSKKTTTQFKGITSEEEALVMGRYLLATSKYLRRVITFDADIEAITQTVGDLIAVQTDVTQYGIGGMVIKRIGNLVTLDEVVSLEKGRTYTLKIKNHLTDIVKDYTFVASDIEPSENFSFDGMVNTPLGVLKFDDFELVVQFQDGSYIETSMLIVPEGYEINVNDRYAFGIYGSDSILCTITDISRDGDLQRSITAIEYNESILDFDYDNDIIQRIEVNKRRTNTISNVTASDRLVKTNTNETVAMLSISWDATISSFYNVYILEGTYKHYLGNNIKGTRFEYPAVDLQIETNYEIFVEDAMNVGIFDSVNHTITAFSAVPEPITDFTIKPSKNSIDFNISYPNKPLDFSYYVLKVNGVIVTKSISDVFSIPASSTLEADYEIYPVDMIGKTGESLVKPFTITKPTIEGVTYSIVNDFVEINITSVKGSFDIAKYTTIFDTSLVERTTNSVSLRADWSGTKTVSFYVTDVAGNVSSTFVLDITISVPAVNNLNAMIDGRDAVISWATPNTPLSIEYYVVSYDSTSVQVKSSSFRVPVTWVGLEVFSVYAVTSYGIVGVTSNIDIVITPPDINNVQAEVIDNNVLLRWTSLQKSLPIDTYYVYKLVNNLPVFIGAKTGSFTTVFESESGVYTYLVSAVDTAGNEGTAIPVTTQVSEPPDYVLNVDWSSTFSGTSVNALLSDNVLYLPINTSETIAEHFDNNMWTSAQDQIDAGYTLWVEPFELTGSYTEVFDYGTVLSSSLITTNISYITLHNTPSIVITISTSEDGVTYTDYVGQQQVYGTNFRYVKLNISVTGPNSAIGISNIRVKLDSKIKSDSGAGTAVSTDTLGTEVLFNKSFVDILSIVVTPKGTTPVIAIYDFEDVPNPTGFKVLLYNTNGNRVNGAFSWSVRGY